MRLFIAVNFTPEIKSALLRAQDALRAAGSGNFSRPENLHLTLAFIGETRDASAAKAALASLSSPPFALTLAGTGRFGDLYWAGAGRTPELSALAGEVRSALLSRGVAFDRRPFSPHVTLVREFRSDEPPRFSVPAVSMTVSRVSLMRSDRAAGRLTYSEIFAKDLAQHK